MAPKKTVQSAETARNHLGVVVYGTAGDAAAATAVAFAVRFRAAAVALRRPRRRETNADGHGTIRPHLGIVKHFHSKVLKRS